MTVVPHGHLISSDADDRNNKHTELDTALMLYTRLHLAITNVLKIEINKSTI